MTIDGIDLLVAVLLFALLLGLEHLYQWCKWNEARKDERRVQRNLRRAGMLR